jgi:hypothetical protein
MTGDNHSRERGPIERAIAEVFARLACEHSHGSKRPRKVPCEKHRDAGAWWGYVIEGHVPDVQLAIVGVNVDTLHAAVSAAGEGNGDEQMGARAGVGPDGGEDQPGPDADQRA